MLPLSGDRHSRQLESQESGTSQTTNPRKPNTSWWHTGAGAGKSGQEAWILSLERTGFCHLESPGGGALGSHSRCRPFPTLSRNGLGWGRVGRGMMGKDEEAGEVRTLWGKEA